MSLAATEYMYVYIFIWKDYHNITHFHIKQPTRPPVPSPTHLDGYRRGGVDEGASGQPSPGAGVSQEGDGGEPGGEHACPDWGEHSGGAPGDLLGLRTQRDATESTLVMKHISHRYK